MTFTNISDTIHHYLNQDEIVNKIINNNLYKTRYGNNNDCFIHIRLGKSVEKWNPGFEYYDSVLSKLVIVVSNVSILDIKLKDDDSPIINSSPIFITPVLIPIESSELTTASPLIVIFPQISVLPKLASLN